MQGFDRGDDAGHAGLIVQVARADKAVGHLHARVEGARNRPPRCPGARVSSAVVVRASRRTSMVSSSRLVSLTCRAVARARRLSPAAASRALLAPQRVKTVTPFAFDRVPGIPADFGQLQPPVGFDLLDHRAQRIDVGGQAARGALRCRPGQAASSAPLRVRDRLSSGKARRFLRTAQSPAR